MKLTTCVSRTSILLLFFTASSSFPAIAQGFQFATDQTPPVPEMVADEFDLQDSTTQTMDAPISPADPVDSIPDMDIQVQLTEDHGTCVWDEKCQTFPLASSYNFRPVVEDLCSSGYVPYRGTYINDDPWAESVLDEESGSTVNYIGTVAHFECRCM